MENLYWFGFVFWFWFLGFVGLHVRLSKTGAISRLHEFVSPVRDFFFPPMFLRFLLWKEKSLKLYPLTFMAHIQAVFQLSIDLYSLGLGLLKALADLFWGNFLCFFLFCVLGRISSGAAGRISLAMPCLGCSGCCRDVEKEWALPDKPGTPYSVQWWADPSSVCNKGCSVVLLGAHPVQRGHRVTPTVNRKVSRWKFRLPGFISVFSNGLSSCLRWVFWSVRTLSYSEMALILLMSTFRSHSHCIST